MLATTFITVNISPFSLFIQVVKIIVLILLLCRGEQKMCIPI